MTECPKRFTLVRMASDDLSPDQTAAARAHLEQCKACRTLFAQIEGTAGEFRPRQEEQAKLLRARLSVQGTQPVRTRWTLAASVAAALVGLLVVFLWPADSTEPDNPVYKGDLAVRLFAKRDQAQFRISPGQSLQAGDRLRIELTTASQGSVTIFSVDSNGKLSPLYPDTDPAGDPLPWSIESAGVHLLPGAVTLDAKAGREWLMVFFSAHRFTRHQVHARLGSLDLASRPEEAKSIAKQLQGVVEVVPVTIGKPARD